MRFIDRYGAICYIYAAIFIGASFLRDNVRYFNKILVKMVVPSEFSVICYWNLLH